MMTPEQQARFDAFMRDMRETYQDIEQRLQRNADCIRELKEENAKLRAQLIEARMRGSRQVDDIQR